MAMVAIGPRELGGFGLAVKFRVEDRSLPQADLARFTPAVRGLPKGVPGDMVEDEPVLARLRRRPGRFENGGELPGLPESC
jgi:hypothetical protein